MNVYRFQRFFTFVVFIIIIFVIIFILQNLRTHEKDFSISDFNNEPLSETFLKENRYLPSSNAHIFYYAWYGSPQHDGKYYHWNHRILPHWKETKAIKLERHNPPWDIASSFYPKLGPYSSSDQKTLENHMNQIKKSGVGTIVLSWYPPFTHDDEGIYSPQLVDNILDEAHKYGLKVCFHIEPYKSRTVVSVKRDISIIILKYKYHPAFYHLTHNNKTLPLFYIYDSYLIKAEDWKKMLVESESSLSIRNSKVDAWVIGLLVEQSHKTHILESNFDGFYTYFGSKTFSFGSNHQHWGGLKKFADGQNILFIPSVAPGYIDQRVRPWNKIQTHSRMRGLYYQKAFTSAMSLQCLVISITSFNEWHEGTQIEEAVPYSSDTFSYLDYSPHPSDHYLTLTRKWLIRFSETPLSNHKTL